MARKIFETQMVSPDGEIVSITTLTVAKFYETYVAGRTTDGLEWLDDLTGLEVKLLMYLTEIEDLKTKITNLGTTFRQKLMKRLDIKANTLVKYLKALEDKKYLIRLSSNELILKPSAFYKGHSKEVAPRIAAFELMYEKIMKERADQKSI